MAKTKPFKKSKKPVNALSEGGKLIPASFYVEALNDTNKRYNVGASGLRVPTRHSFGLLSYDFISGGGIVPGAMVIVEGKEGSAKTTLTSHVVTAAAGSGIPLIRIKDPENALNEDLISHISKVDVVGMMQEGPAKRIYYDDDNGLELYYNSTKHLLKKFPDKRWDEETKNWYYVFDSDKEGRAQLAKAGFTEKDYDKKKYQQTKRLWVKTDNSVCQLLDIIDSYAALIPEAVDEDDETKTNPALVAKAFADNIKKVKGRTRRKAAIIFGTNQIRVNPMPKYGQQPEYSVGGSALGYYSDLRFIQTKVSVPKDQPKGRLNNGDPTFEYSTEKSVYGSDKTDNYVWIRVKNTKNKMGPPMLRMMMRVLFRDGLGRFCGFDPVWDTFNYIKMTGRVEGSQKKGFKFNVPALDKKIKGFSNRKFTYDEFKLLIMAETYQEPELLKRVKSELKIEPIVRKVLFKEVHTIGKVRELMNASQKSAKEEADEDLED